MDSKRRELAERKQKQSLKRTVALGGRPISVSLEDPFWVALREIATAENTTRPKLIEKINTQRKHANLSSAIRLFILGYYRALMPKH
jgi:predicted DNA-binding ribbon-helix-helix protein